MTNYPSLSIPSFLTNYPKGGADLTPSYLFDEDAKYFHGVYRRVCADFGPADFHQRLKRW